jgi:hypothetical protein
MGATWHSRSTQFAFMTAEDNPIQYKITDSRGLFDESRLRIISASPAAIEKCDRSERRGHYTRHGRAVTGFTTISPRALQPSASRSELTGLARQLGHDKSSKSRAQHDKPSESRAGKSSESHDESTISQASPVLVLIRQASPALNAARTAHSAGRASRKTVPADRAVTRRPNRGQLGLTSPVSWDRLRTVTCGASKAAEEPTGASILRRVHNDRAEPHTFCLSGNDEAFL